VGGGNWRSSWDGGMVEGGAGQFNGGKGYYGSAHVMMAGYWRCGGTRIGFEEDEWLGKWVGRGGRVC